MDYENDRPIPKRSNKMRNSLIAVAIIIVLAVGACMACITVIPAGYVGVVYNISGGVEEGVKTQGWKFILPTQKVTLYCIATQQVYLSADSREGSSTPENFDVPCSDGMVDVDLEMSYNIPIDRVPDIFVKYAGMDGEDVVNTFIRGKLKTYVAEVTANYTVLEVVMDKKAEVNRMITEHLQEKLREFGLEVESANLSRAEPDENVQAAISERSQLAQQVEIERKTQEKLQLEAENKVIEANGEAQKDLIRANNQAEIQRVQADAEAYANKVIAESISQPLIDMEEAKARVEHGWVEVQGVSNAIVDTRSNSTPAPKTTTPVTTPTTAD